MVFFAVAPTDSLHIFGFSEKVRLVIWLMAVSLESNKLQSSRPLPADDSPFPALDFVEYRLIAVRYLRLKLRNNGGWRFRNRQRSIPDRSRLAGFVDFQENHAG